MKLKHFFPLWIYVYKLAYENRKQIPVPRQMISKKNKILQFFVGLEYFHSGCKHVEVALVCEAWSHGVTIFTPAPWSLIGWASPSRALIGWWPSLVTGSRREQRSRGVSWGGAMEQSAVDIIRHTLHYIPDSVLSQKETFSMMEINRKKLKAAFILHLFSATFVLLAFQNFVSDI